MKYMSSCINYNTKEQAQSALLAFQAKGMDVAISSDGMSITTLQDKPVQAGQVPYIG